VSLIVRFAIAGAIALGAAVAVALLVWQPASRDAFVNHTEGLLRSTESDFSGLATSLVDETMSFAAASARAADAQRALALQDLPLELYTDAEGHLEPDRLREALRLAVADPESSGAGKLAAVRAELLHRTRRDVERRLERLRGEQRAAAGAHGETVAWKTVAAWTGLLLLLLAGFGLLLDRFALKPLREATEAVERFGAGERGVRLDPRGARELATLAAVFNETAAANEQMRDELENKVKERTAALVRAARASTAGTMAGGVAHEFNNLLGGILGCAGEALEEEVSADARAMLEMIRKTATRGVEMTQAMLRATRAEPEMAECNADALLDEVLAEVRAPDGITVERSVTVPTFQGDAGMLRQVLTNLVRNAVTAMGESGTLTLAIDRDASGDADGNDGVRIVVADSGPGIDPSIREILFEPFVTTRRGGREGAGLGLFLAERLIGAHGGSITVESEAGRGTRFEIRLARDS